MSFNKSLLELTIKGKDFVLRNVSKTSPQCIVYLRTTGANSTGRYVETGRTEVIRNSRNPEWSIKVPIGYRFNEWQTLRLEVWDYDICADNELLGQMELELAALIARKTDTIKKRLKLELNDQTVGQVLVTGELWLTIDEVLASKQTIQMQFEAKNLPQKDFLGSSDPYLTLTKENFDGTDTQVYRSEVIHKTLDPIWTEFTLRVEELCDCDHHKRLKISCFDWDRHTSDDFIGAVTTCLHDLNRQFSGSTSFELRKDQNLSQTHSRKGLDSELKTNKRRSILLKAIKTNPNQSYGQLVLRKLHFRQVPTFVDYIRSGGTQIHLMYAIDCTIDSLPFHRRLFDNNGRQMNCFEYIIHSLGQTVHHYDYQGLYAGFGFGAKLLPDLQLSHEFNLKTNSIVPYCDSVDDVIRSYKTSLMFMEASGPRHIAPVINHVLKLTKNFQNGKHYFVATIITTGSNVDNADTLEAIVRASALPLSLVIVGVGNSQFTALKRLSGDSTCSRGTRTYRNNIQFFQLKNYLTPELMDSNLSKDLLESIPAQMLEYMESRNYLPQK